MAIHSAGETYDSNVTDFSETGPRADADTLAGAGSITLDLLRYIQRVSKNGMFEPSVTRYDLQGSVSTTLTHAVRGSQVRRRCAETLGSSIQEQPVVGIAVNYVQRRDEFGILLEPTALNLTAGLGAAKPYKDSLFFTNISTDDGSPHDSGSSPLTEKRLTVNVAQMRSASLHPPYYPPSFQHVRRWTDMLGVILDQ